MSGSDSDRELERIVGKVLRAADAIGRYPTPVEDIVAAVGLYEAEESLLAEGALAGAPARIKRAWRLIRGKVRGLLDRKERQIHLDPTILLEVRRRFIRLHEVVHDVVPWQREVAVRIDTDETLSPQVRALFEVEASTGAAHFLFQLNGFTTVTRDLEVGIGAILLGAPQFGGSLRAGLRRYVERHDLPMVGFVLDTSPQPGSPLRFLRREIVTSAAYRERFPPPFAVFRREMSTERYPFIVQAAAAGATRNTSVCGKWQTRDANGDPVTLRSEFYCTSYDTLVLMWLPTAKPKRRLLSA